MGRDIDFEWLIDEQPRLKILKQIGASNCISVDEIVYINPKIRDDEVGEIMLELYERSFIEAVTDESLPSYLPQNYYYISKKGEMALKKANEWGGTKEYKEKLENLACVDYIMAIRQNKPSV